MTDRLSIPQINIYVMSVIFFIPLSLIALYESQVEHSRRFLELFPEENLEAEGDPSVEDPEAENDEGNQISKVKFAELVGSFPDATLGDQATIVNEIVRPPFPPLLFRTDSWADLPSLSKQHKLSKMIDQLQKEISGNTGESGGGEK